jgi:hypothetical protein
MDIFSNDAFGAVSLLRAQENVAYSPQFLGSLNIFDEERVRTRTVGVEMRDGVLSLIPTTPIGAPLPQLVDQRRNIRDLRTVRLAKGSTIYAEELQGIRAFGSDTELLQVQTEVARHQSRLTQDMELTWEHMRLGAIQGKLIDSDNSVLLDYFDEFDVAEPAAVALSLATGAMGLRRQIESLIVRPMIRASKGRVMPSSRIVALVGDDFWDIFVNSETIRQTYLNQAAATELRSKTLYSVFPFAGVDWINYRGTDDNSTVAVAADEAIFFPVNAPDIFKVVWGPGEFMDSVNRPGEPVRPLVLPDPSGRQAFVTVELYSYPLFLCTMPQVLRRATLST